ncbi:L-fucose:H+ symporter permease [Paraflavitalea sp. CAU 1676]|uniref:L-fucose:H+ symporter permease n=1 Tax=Paraflavitalea sp. CAU 1676 TaxID=3032598 RepID=UPI0023DACD28|nr:L-fucose:H+ symporter permease [Paraflavitalea sp. CAU 1676]MDF2193300.1 L-fucose:H+ symporter permease [Paraflavitalea sp. CAU 1676]
MPGIASPTLPKQTTGTGKIMLLPFILVTSLFFFWGFVHNLDPILIPHLRKAFLLNDLQSSLVDSAVFIAYFLMALPAGYVMRKFGYKWGILLGLLFFGVGCFLFIPAADTRQYIFFLGALFVIACGLAFLETAANPYATVLGPPHSATQRLNLAQSFNGLAAMVAPLIGKQFILSGKNYTEEELNAMLPAVKDAYLQSEADSVKMPYLILGIAIIIVAIVIYFTHMPDTKEEGDKETKSVFHAFRHKHLTWAVIAQFFYVGAQVCVGSFFIKLSMRVGLTEGQAATYLALGYGLAFMVGRFVGTFLMRTIKPATLLTWYAVINVVLSIVAIFATGIAAVYSLIGIAFFMSIMFPTIFSLGIQDLGNDTKLGSSLIVMSIVGGALLPPVLGVISDATNNIQYGYIVPLICFVVVGYFGWKGHKTKSLGEYEEAFRAGQ